MERINLYMMLRDSEKMQEVFAEGFDKAIPDKSKVTFEMPREPSVTLEFSCLASHKTRVNLLKSQVRFYGPKDSVRRSLSKGEHQYAVYS